MKRPIELIEAIVCAGEKVDPEELQRKTRGVPVPETRQIIAYFALKYENTGEEINRRYNLKHPHATLSRKKIHNLRMTYKEFDDKMTAYDNEIKGENCEKLSYVECYKNKLRREITKLKTEINQLEKII